MNTDAGKVDSQGSAEGAAALAQVQAIFAVLLEVLHKLCSLTLIFLAGLALRNLFKMKG